MACASWLLLALCLGCESTELNDTDTAEASDALYEAARMEHPVPLAVSTLSNLSTVPIAEDEAVRRRRAKGWAKKCVVQHPCRALRSLPKCKAASGAMSYFPSSPAALLGQTVTLRGALHVGKWVTTAMGCAEFPLKGCCTAVGAETLLLVGQTVVSLPGLGCGGDESGVCCDVPAFGQRVVVSGELLTGLSVEAWSLQNAQLCVDQ